MAASVNFCDESDIMCPVKLRNIEMRNFDLFRNKIISCTMLIFFAGMLLAACGKKEVKPVSPVSKLTEDAFQLADTLRKAYLKNDRESLERNSTQDGYRQIAESMKSFESADLTFTPTWVEIQDSTMKLTISWKGTWVIRGKTTEDRGSAIFVLQRKPLKLAQIQRSNPFAGPE
jgi:hypothetical protein